MGRMWPGVFPVQIVGFFVYQYIWKGLIIMLNFLHGDNHQEKLASEATTFSWMWLLTNQIAGFCDQYYLWKKLSYILVFMYGVIVISGS